MDYDIAIVGSGIAGTTLAMVLRKQGASVVVIEKGQHPRFVIGESTVPASTMSWVYLASTYDLPDLLSFCHYPALKENGLGGYPKSNFYFALHEEGRPLDPSHQAMFETYPLGIGPDVHMLRSDVDAHLVSRLADHGIEYRDRTEVADFSYDGRWAILDLDGAGEARVRARLVFDATGHSSFFGRRLGLRDDEPRLHTNTRAMFGHFRGTKLLEPLLPPEDCFRYNRDAGTVHHCFEGGWIWVIPFDDGLVSMGILLDREAFPLDSSVPVEDEWRAIIERYPTVAAQIGDAVPTRPIIRTDRIQFSSRKTSAPGVVLTPHAAAFVDPLFSTGLTQTAAFIGRVAPIVARCLEDDDFDHRRFEPVERAFQREVDATDKIVSGVIASFDDYEVFRQSWQSWIVGTNLQIVGRVVGDQGDAEGCALNFGVASEPWRKELDQRHRVAMDKTLTPLERAYQLETPLCGRGGWSDQWCWTKAQWKAAGFSLTTIRRLLTNAAFRLVRRLLPVSLHADNVFFRTFNSDVHSAGPISVQVMDPAELDASDPSLKRTHAFVVSEMGGTEKVRVDGWHDLAERAREMHAAHAEALASDEPPARAAALRAITRRSTADVGELEEKDPALIAARR